MHIVTTKTATIALLNSRKLFYRVFNTMPGRRGGGSSRGGRPPPSRETTISKAMSFVLRHGAQAEGLKLDKNGFANVADLVCEFSCVIW